VDPQWAVPYAASGLGIDGGNDNYWLVFLLFYAVGRVVPGICRTQGLCIHAEPCRAKRVGPYGIFQTIADFIKLLMKELVTIKNSDKLLFNLAPFIVIIASFMAIAAIPFAKGLHAIDFDIGILFM
jgi:NADH-quinone oxidoreductase subunit H